MMRFMIFPCPLQAVLETVARITHDKSKKNDTHEAKYAKQIELGLCKVLLNVLVGQFIEFSCSGTRAFQLQDVFNLENEGSDDDTTLIDKKVCLLISDGLTIITALDWMPDTQRLLLPGSYCLNFYFDFFFPNLPSIPHGRTTCSLCPIENQNILCFKQI